jgi:hypothetical protein
MADGAAAQLINFKNCYFRRSGTTRSGLIALKIAVHAGDSTVNIDNCIFHSFNGTTNSAVYTASAQSLIYNCTFHDNTVAVNDVGGGYLLVKNCLFDGNAANKGANAWAVGSDYNSSTEDVTWDPAEANGKDPCADFNFADLANHDFRLTATSGDPNARNSGLTIAACSPDPIGTTRPSETNYSRGAFEYVVAAGGGHPAMKRFGGVPHVAVNKGVW